MRLGIEPGAQLVIRIRTFAEPQVRRRVGVKLGIGVIAFRVV